MSNSSIMAILAVAWALTYYLTYLLFDYLYLSSERASKWERKREWERWRERGIRTEHRFFFFLLMLIRYLYFVFYFRHFFFATIFTLRCRRYQTKIRMYRLTVKVESIRSTFSKFYRWCQFTHPQELTIRIMCLRYIFVYTYMAILWIYIIYVYFYSTISFVSAPKNKWLGV